MNNLRKVLLQFWKLHASKAMASIMKWCSNSYFINIRTDRPFPHV